MNKKKHKSSFLFLTSVLTFIAGVGFFLYPLLSNYFAEKNQRDIIQIYDTQVDKMKEEQLAEERRLAETYNDNLAGDPLHDPFIAGSGYAVPENYYDVLNINGDGVIGYVEIPKIDVYLPIYHGTSKEVLERGAGHIEGTSLPVGGINRFSVISAHRGLPGAELFIKLNELGKDDVFYIHVLDETLAYRVDKTEVIEPQQLTSVTGEADKDTVVLMTCTPYAVNSHRLLVFGQRTSIEEANDTGENHQKQNGMSKWLKEYLQAIMLGAVLLIGIFLFLKHRKKRRL